MLTQKRFSLEIALLLARSTKFVDNIVTWAEESARATYVEVYWLTFRSDLIWMDLG